MHPRLCDLKTTEHACDTYLKRARHHSVRSEDKSDVDQTRGAHAHTTHNCGFPNHTHHSRASELPSA